MLLKSEAEAIAKGLLECPFCGAKPTASIRGPGDVANNPRARCMTEDCMGSKLPALGLDVASQVEAWNTRVCTPTVGDMKRLAQDAGYSVHGAVDETQGWAFCIDGDYSREYRSEDVAWVQAHADMVSNQCAAAE